MKKESIERKRRDRRVTLLEIEKSFGYRKGSLGVSIDYGMIHLKMKNIS